MTEEEELVAENSRLRKALSFLAERVQHQCWALEEGNRMNDWCNLRGGRCTGCIEAWAIERAAR